MDFRSLNHTQNVFGLIFQNVADPVEELSANLHDGPGFTHPLQVLMKGHHEGRIFSGRNPGGLDEQPAQLRMTSMGDPSGMGCLTALMGVWDQTRVAQQLVQRPKAVDIIEFCQQDHGRQRADPWNGPQQPDLGPIRLGPGQSQDGPVHRGDDLSQMGEFLQMNLQSRVSTGPVHLDGLDPPDESPGPVAHDGFLGKMDTIKKEHRFDLVLATGLLSDHALAGPHQTAIFQLRAAGDIDALEFSVPQIPGEFTAIGPIPFASSLFVLGRHIRRIDHDRVDALVLELVMDPKTAVTRLIDRMIPSTRKVTSEVTYKLVRLGGLGECLVLAMVRKNAHAPAPLMDIQTDVNVLTRKINSATLTHGKSPFGECFVSKQNHYNRKCETCLFFSIIRSESRLGRGEESRLCAVIPRSTSETLHFVQSDGRDASSLTVSAYDP